MKPIPFISALLHARIPVSSPPPLDPFSTPLIILFSRDTYLLERVCLRECSHTSPRIQQRIRRTHRLTNRHLRRQYRPECGIHPLAETRKLRRTASEEHILYTARPSARANDTKKSHFFGLTLTRRAFSASVNRARTLCSTSPTPAESTPAMLGEKYVSQTRHRSVFKCIRLCPAISPSSYCGRNAANSADRLEDSEACVCWVVNIGSYCSSLLSIV